MITKVVLKRILSALQTTHREGATIEELLVVTRLCNWELSKALVYLQHTRDVAKVNAWLTTRLDLPSSTILFLTTSRIEELKAEKKADSLL